MIKYLITFSVWKANAYFLENYQYKNKYIGSGVYCLEKGDV